MDKQLKQQWVAALRSGEYQQGSGTLKLVVGEDQPHYCCLGVLAEIAEPESLRPRPYDDNYLFRDTAVAYLIDREGNYLYLPEDVQKLLAEANDSEEKTFAEIADLIEQIVPEDEG